MRRRTLLAGATALAATSTARRAKAQRDKAKVLRFVPQANLANPDPVWTTATVAANHGYMVWDTLYGINNALVAQPQMLAGHETSPDELTWTFTLRDGLKFHDNEPVRAIDCTTSIRRWSAKDPFGQTLAARTAEMKPLDDKRFQIRLKQRFRQMTYALGAGNCFVMPSRMAETPASQQIKEYVGSGPFVFKRDEWISGASAAYEKFAGYVPRQEKPEYFSGGKVVHFDRVEWIVQPDPATAGAALQMGEVDWIEFPLLDLLPTLTPDKGCQVVRYDPFGAMAIMAFNHLYPPFDNPAILRALLPAIDQSAFVTAWVGDQQQYGRTPVGFFTAGSPMASDAGMEALTSPRDLNKAKRLLKEAGYKGEKIILMSPSDQASIEAPTQVARDLLMRLGMNIDYQVMDWGTLVARRAKQDPPDQGGWNMFCTTWGGLQVSNPGSSFPLRANGRQGWFGWPTDAKIEALRQDWFDAPDQAAQKKICEQIQQEAFDSIPFMPLGQWFYPWAIRADLTGIVQCASVLFWGVRRA
ncbi:MAG TPA: ABC transporter substrate-binding protein [Rhodopila sp.]|nr:ABC transporter substrate-binding protein [Rhodopila sp.]